jgi:membrane protease YdiL (CAAX protease family)
MLRRILMVWFVANFILVGAVSWATGSWYLQWPIFAGIVAELGLIMIPNFLLSVALLKFWWTEPVSSLRSALGWTWNGWRSITVGIGAFIISLALSGLITGLFGDSIPYQLPGREGTVGPVENFFLLLGLLMFLLAVVVITVVSEETLFRGLIQTQVGIKYGPWLGFVLAVLLFGLRHLPADLFYAHAWHTTPQMWLSRQLQLYSFAIVLGLARRYGRSTYAPAIAHAMMYVANLFG